MVLVLIRLVHFLECPEKFWASNMRCHIDYFINSSL